MGRIFVVTSFFIVSFTLVLSGEAAECTIDRGSLDTALRQTSSCGKAYRIFESCAFGAGRDVSLGAIVQEKCETEFLGRLNAAKMDAYKKQLAACDRKYAEHAGSMYRSFEAFCRAGVARAYASRFLRKRRCHNPRCYHRPK
jgi:hypothetical protein